MENLYYVVLAIFLMITANTSPVFAEEPPLVTPQVIYNYNLSDIEEFVWFSDISTRTNQQISPMISSPTSSFQPLTAIPSVNKSTVIQHENQRKSPNFSIHNPIKNKKFKIRMY